MTSDSQFFIDDKPYKLERSPEKVGLLLQLAGTSSKDAVLVSEDGVEHGNPDELIDIRPDERFKTRKRDSSEKPVEKPIRYTASSKSTADRATTPRTAGSVEPRFVPAPLLIDPPGSYPKPQRYRTSTAIQITGVARHRLHEEHLNEGPSRCGAIFPREDRVLSVRRSFLPQSQALRTPFSSGK